MNNSVDLTELDLEMDEIVALWFNWGRLYGLGDPGLLLSGTRGHLVRGIKQSLLCLRREVSEYAEPIHIHKRVFADVY